MLFILLIDVIFLLTTVILMLSFLICGFELGIRDGIFRMSYLKILT